MQWVVQVMRDITPGAAGVWVLVLAVLGWMLQQYRENRKLSDADKIARRQGYEVEVRELRDECRALRADQTALRDDYDKYRRDCQEETDELRAENRQLRGIIEGLQTRVKLLTDALARFDMDDPMAKMLVMLDRPTNPTAEDEQS